MNTKIKVAKREVYDSRDGIEDYVIGHLSRNKSQGKTSIEISQ